MQHKQLIGIAAVFIVVTTLALAFRLSRDASESEKSLQSGRANNGGTEGQLRDGATNVVPRTPESRLAGQTRWPTQAPPTTISNLPSDYARRPAGASDAACNGFHGTWQLAAVGRLQLEPRGTGTWTIDSTRTQPITWQCSRTGDVRVQLPNGTLELARRSGSELLERSADGSARAWTRVAQP